MRDVKIIIGLIVLMAMMGITGCSSELADRNSTSTGINSGVAVDPYIEGAVFQEVAADGTVLQRQSTPSDAQGVFVFPKPLSEGSRVDLKVSQKGMHEGAPFEGMLKRKVNSDNAGALIVSPLTTLLANGVTEQEIIDLFSDVGLGLTREDLYRDPMQGVSSLSGQFSDEQLKTLHANMAVNHFMMTIGQFNVGKSDLDEYDNFQLFAALIKANKDLLNGTEFARINSELGTHTSDNAPLLVNDLLTAVVQTMRTVVAEAKFQHANGTLDLAGIGQDVSDALQNATQEVLALYLVRVSENTPPVDVNGVDVFAAECAGCHNLGSGGTMDLTGKGVAVTEKVAGGHKNKTLSAGELQALVTYVDSLVAPPTPDPEPTPDGKTVYDTLCAGCHRLGKYDLSGTAPDLAGTEAMIPGKINLGHKNTSLSNAEVTALVDWVALNPTIPTPDPEPTPDPVPDGVALYESECQGCHGPLASNNIQDRTASGIQQAINANLGNMGMLTMSAEEVQAIADNLPTPTPDPDPVPADGKALYDNSCAFCHSMGAYDTSGAPELGGAGNLVMSKIEAGHQGFSMTTDEINALASWANANPAPVPDPVPVPADGKALYDNKCSNCHSLSDYDTTGASEIGGAGNLIIGKIEAGHNSISLTADELNALADWADANPAPAPNPDPVPVDGKNLYDNNCSGCHAVNEYDASGAPDLASAGSLVAAKLAAGHKGFVLTTEEEVALADFLDLYPALPSGPDYSDCTLCHAQPPNGNSFPNTAGAHAVHSALTGVGTDCAVCHEGSDHNDLLDVFISQTYNSKGETATANTDGTCSAVSCHGGKTTPDWSSGSLSVNTQCKSCHSSGTGEFNGYYSGKHKKHAVDKGYDCTVCHNTGKLDGGHFSNLSSSGFELSPADTIGGGSTQVGSYSGGRCSSVQCHGSEDW